MSPDFTVRHPKLHEAEGIASVHVKAWEEAYSGIFPEQFWNEESYQRRLNSWRQMLADQAHRARTRVTEVDGTIVGMAQIGPPHEEDVDVEHELYMMYLLAEHQGSGASSAMLEELLNNKSASLWVLKDNPRAQAFYRKHGFEPDGEEIDLGEDEGSGALRGIVEIRMVRGPQ
ncbi:GNAT family N-acetyltransferase [Nesterenkonia haasae]|uniref:GNAT family N-acetyltransferase n=1 Tax=Nesterenkonia haasae TaxID=2587813 RepID=UPI0012923EB3|nr:GNAT family N-acetyltransferase [Nesterenkonia haasae]NDK32388.1 GNAT family N-acetyltransferase [Nesterenkonia haasae]